MRNVMAACAAVVAIASSSGCGAGNPAEVASRGTPSEVAESASFAWALDGDGVAEHGSTDVSFHGTHHFTDTGVWFDGGTGYAATDGPGPIDTTTSFTVATWVSLFPPSLLGAAVYADAVSQVGTLSAAFNLGAAEGQWAFSMRDTDDTVPGQAIRAMGGTATPSSDTWVHLVGVHDEAAGQIRLYVDGRPAASTAFTAPWRADGPLTIGRGLFGAPSGFWSGAIDDVRVFTTALTDQQISDLADQTRPTGPPPPRPDTTSALSVINGTYQFEYTTRESEHLAELFGPEAEAAGFPGKAAVILRFSDGLWQQYFSINGEAYTVGGRPEGDGGTYTLDGDQLHLTNQLGTGNYRWSLDEDELSLTLLDTPPDAAIVKFVMQHKFTRTHA